MSIETIYNKSGFFDNYGKSTMIVIVIISIFMLIFIYNYFLSLIYQRRNDFKNDRCNPKYLAFSHILSKVDARTNFDECVKKNLKDVAESSLLPLNYAANGVLNVQKNNITTLKNVRTYTENVKQHMVNNVEKVAQRLVGFLVPTHSIILKIKDTYQKSTAVILASMYAFFGFLTTLKSSMRYFLAVLVTYLVTLSGSVSSQFALPMNIATSQLGLQYFLLLAVPVGIMVHWFEKIFNVKKGIYTIPPNPRCFDKNVLVPTRKGFVRMKDLKIGMELRKGERVTAILKLAFEGETMYNVDGILVTGSHMIQHQSYGWVPVYQHPRAKIQVGYKKPFVYCINTTTKRIKLGRHTFLDWDDIDETDFKKLQKKVYLRSCKDIHRNLDSGFVGETLVSLWNGERKKIKKIKINELLKNGERVIGLVKTKSKQKIMKYTFKYFEVLGTGLLFNNLGKSNEMKNETNEFLYHLITDVKNFYIGNVKFQDYNGILEQYDEEENYLLRMYKNV